jgi:toxin-antitoxin system PIN domain toxin
VEVLPDVNFLIAWFHDRHEHSAAAQSWLDANASDNSVFICRAVHMGCLRLLTTSRVMGTDRLDPISAWRGWETVINGDDRFGFIDEPVGLDACWATVLQAIQPQSIADTDTYIAAFAMAADLTLLTFDKGFRRFPGLKSEIISSE